MDKQKDLLDFWFDGCVGDTRRIEGQIKVWFGQGGPGDAELARRFGALVTAVSNGEHAHWSATARGRLALVLALDQLTRSIHRGTHAAFANDAQALTLALEGIDYAHDDALAPIERVFLYMPLEHSESRAMQRLSVALFERLARALPDHERAPFDAFVSHARQHRDIVMRFGRFPHRNAVLGRRSSQAELEWLKDGPRFGQG